MMVVLWLCLMTAYLQRIPALQHHYERTGCVTSSCWMRYCPTCATPANALVMSSGDTPFALRYRITPSASSPPIDAINEIIPTSPQDMDRAQGALLPSAQGSISLPYFAGIISINIPFL